MDLVKVTEIKCKVEDINNADTVIVYGSVYGNINNADNVVIINGDLHGSTNNCENVLGTITDQSIGNTALMYKSIADTPITRKDIGISDTIHDTNHPF